MRNPEAVREHSVADIDEEEEFGSLSRRSVRDSVQPPSVVGLLTKPVLLVLISFIFTTFENSAWNALVPLYAYTRQLINPHPLRSYEQSSIFFIFFEVSPRLFEN